VKNKIILQIILSSVLRASYFVDLFIGLTKNGVCLIRSRNCQVTIQYHPGSSPVFRGVRVVHVFSFLCCVVVLLCFVCFRPHVTCVLNVARVCGLSIPDCPLFCLFSSSRDLCTQCCQSLWIVHS
jgi:hypothetical protein